MIYYFIDLTLLLTSGMTWLWCVTKFNVRLIRRWCTNCGFPFTEMWRKVNHFLTTHIFFSFSPQSLVLWENRSTQQLSVPPVRMQRQNGTINCTMSEYLLGKKSASETTGFAFPQCLFTFTLLYGLIFCNWKPNVATFQWSHRRRPTLHFPDCTFHTLGLFYIPSVLYTVCVWHIRALLEAALHS